MQGPLMALDGLVVRPRTTTGVDPHRAGEVHTEIDEGSAEMGIEHHLLSGGAHQLVLPKQYLARSGVYKARRHEEATPEASTCSVIRSQI